LHVALRAIVFINVNSIVPPVAGLVCGLFVVAGMLYTFFGWFWALAHRLHAELPVNHGMQLYRLRLAVLVPVIYFSALFLIGSLMVFPPLTNFGFDVLTPINMAGGFACSIFCIFYSIYFCSKSLKMVELNRFISFSDYIGDFFLMCFFPVGIWFIQPRINSIFRQVPQQDVIG
jgi:hypothetical protein